MKYFKFLLLIFLIALVGITAYKYFYKNKPADKPTIDDKIETYNYELYSNKGTLFKDVFEELKACLEGETVDEERYASLVAKLFIIDFYTLSDKTSNIDIGGVQFLHSKIADNFKLKAKDTIYKYVKNNIYGDRKQELPTVSKVSVDSIESKPFKSKELSDSNAFYLKMSFDYVKDLGYEKYKEIILIHEDKKLSLISID